MVSFAVGAALLVGLVTLPPSAPAQAQPDLTLPDEALLGDPVFARVGFGGLSQAYLSRTRYLLAIDLDPAQGRLRGKARVLYVNRAFVATDRVIFRLYPNHPVHGGRTMTVSDITVDGVAVQGQLLDVDQTVLSVPLNAVLDPGGSAVIEMNYTITTPGGSFYYLSEPYPVVAVFDASGWRMDVVTKGLDYAFTDSALHAVRLRAPSEISTWFVGTAKSVEPGADGKTTYTVVTGPTRNFVIVQGRGWSSQEVGGASVPIRLYSFDNLAAATEIGQIAAAAFSFYEQNFGSYPYAELKVVSMRFASGGEEYPGLVFINNERNSAYRRFITAHEVAHQWFYGIAGNDTLNNAWLDESLTQVAGYLFYKRGGFGPANAAETYWQSILSWYNRRQTVRKLNTPMAQYRDFPDFMSNIYGGGAVFLRQLGEMIGDDALIGGIRTYVGAVYLGIGTSEQFYASVQSQTTIDLSLLFCEQVGIMCR
jgi:hypothetical protein